MSAIFTQYYLLTNPHSFDSYIICNGGFLDCEEYFNNLLTDFLKDEQDHTTKIFLTHGLKDFLDPDGINKKQLSDFIKKIKANENIVCELKIYEEEGHVPFQSLYHGLKFIYKSDN